MKDEIVFCQLEINRLTDIKLFNIKTYPRDESKYWYFVHMFSHKDG